MRIALRIGAAVAGAAALLLIAVAVAISTIDVHSLLGPIQARVKRATGRDLVVRDLDFRISLRPRVIATEVTLANADWAATPAVFSARRLEAEVALLPLLQRRLETVRLELIEPVVALETDARGRRSWDFGSADTTGARADTAGAGAGEQKGDAGFAFLGSGHLAVDKGRLTYRDGVSGRTTEAAIDRLLLDAKSDGTSVDARFDGSVDGVPIAVTGSFGPLDAIARHRWPYPLEVEGEVAGRKVTLAAKLDASGDAIALRQLALGVGQSRIEGEVAVTPGAARRRVSFKLAAPTLSAADLPLAAPRADAGTGAAAGAGAAAPSRWVFDDRPLGLAALRAVDADGDIAVAHLLLGEGRRADDLRATIALRDGVLDVPAASVAALGGTATIRLRIDAAHDPDDAIRLTVDAKGLDLAALAADLGIRRGIKGGKTDVAADLAMRGASPRHWVSSANGSFAATVGPATLARPNGDANSDLDRIAQAVNPFRRINDATELRCAVVRLPIRNGVAQVDRTIALETREVGVAASGQVDFRNETLDLAVKPHLKQGIPIDVIQLADLVRVGGSFKSPSVRVDKAAAADTVARIGMAVGTGGWSEAARLLLKPPGGDANTCDVAAGRAPPDGAPPAKESKESGGAKGAPKPTDEISKALGRLFGR